MPAERALDQMAQQSTERRGVRKKRAAQDPRELRSHRIGWQSAFREVFSLIHGGLDCGRIPCLPTIISSAYARGSGEPRQGRYGL
jgi:hypothetical protein